MSSNSKIEWTGDTWNPVAGCSIVSPGCTNCYAMRMAARLEAMGQKKYAGTTKKVNRLAVWTGKIALDEEALTIPLRRKKPTTYFVNSMSDLFHEGVPFEFVDKVFAVMALTPQHTFQILTKRAGRMAEYLNGLPARARTAGDSLYGELMFAARSLPTPAGAMSPRAESRFTWPLPNVHLGVSAENQKTADERSEHLRRCPAAVRWYSAEPLLEGVKLPLEGIGWVVVGGESGQGARPCNVEWVRSIVGQCKTAGVACFVKQLGDNVRADGKSLCGWPMGKGSTSDTTYTPPRIYLATAKGGEMEEWPEDLRVRELPAASVTA